MQNTMSFKGYAGSIEISPDDDILFGKVLFISPLINYEAGTEKELMAAFHKAIESYLSDCKEQGLDPEKPNK